MLRICAGQFKGKSLQLPPSDISRPSSNKLRQAIFNILNNLISFENLVVLDGFAGSGALGLEALSRGASKVIFCEKNPKAQRILKQNILSLKTLTERQAELVADLFNLNVSQRFNLIFLDPPYDQDLEEEALRYLLDKDLVASDAIIVIEQRKGAKAIEINGCTAQPPRMYGNCQITLLNHYQKI